MAVVITDMPPAFISESPQSFFRRATAFHKSAARGACPKGNAFLGMEWLPLYQQRLRAYRLTALAEAFADCSPDHFNEG